MFSSLELAGGDRPAESELDALDAYMAAIKSGTIDRRTRMTLRLQLTQMRQQKEILRRRLQAAAPSLSQLALRQSAKATPEVAPAPRSEAPLPEKEKEEEKNEESADNTEKG